MAMNRLNLLRLCSRGRSHNLVGGTVSYLNCLSMETPSTLSLQNRGRPRL